MGKGKLLSNDDSEAAKLTLEVKEIALNSGANLVGVVSARAIDSVPSVWVGWKLQQYTKKTTDVMLDVRYVFVIGYHVWDDMLELAVRKGEKWLYSGYIPLTLSVQAVINRLEKSGYKAVTAPDSLSYKRLAQLAGFGNFGKNALIVNPVFGPWIRLACILTNAEMLADKPFEQNLCGVCEECVKACPVGALTPYRVDDSKCLVGIHIVDKENFERNEKWTKYEPSFTKNSHLMCRICQAACRYGKEERA